MYKLTYLLIIIMSFVKYFALLALIAIVSSNKLEIEHIEPQIHHGPKARGLLTLDINDENVNDFMEFRKINFTKLAACLEPVKSAYEEVFSFIDEKNYLAAYVTLVNIKHKGGDKSAKAKECIEAAISKLTLKK